MDVLILLNHVANFLAPALWLSVGLTLLSHFLMKKVPAALTIKRNIAILFITCSGVLVAALVLFGKDGKLLAYTTLVLSAAAVQGWLQGRGR